jgi:hypothetical protein
VEERTKVFKSLFGVAPGTSVFCFLIVINFYSVISGNAFESDYKDTVQRIKVVGKCNVIASVLP